ncbi:hypothetical protein BCR44DRAFT_1429920 [Catenaria anguillulae PL171]|uniref:Uncharacterized protein n=1 Tax=Catenaria anguillulae PL171 TaxID=765915 RepID=A0A1Y2HT42_9FUNG|nr:hypothetical protein BCR44DRAFT_1429920 [Catenaria anguillulae PL171]
MYRCFLLQFNRQAFWILDVGPSLHALMAWLASGAVCSFQKHMRSLVPSKSAARTIRCFPMHACTLFAAQNLIRWVCDVAWPWTTLNRWDPAV